MIGSLCAPACAPFWAAACGPAGVPGAVHRSHHRHRGQNKKAELGRRRNPERFVSAGEEAEARDQPEAAGDAEHAAVQRVNAGPVCAGCHQEGDRDRGDEAPEHFMGVPNNALQRAGQRLWRIDPDRDRDQRPGDAAQIQRPKGELEKSPQARCREVGLGQLEIDEAVHDQSGTAADRRAAARRGSEAGIRSGLLCS